MIIFNTRRNTVCPLLQELTPEQSAAYFMLGESIETAAGDPAKAGQSVREVGTNPFIVGDAAEEGNIFYEYLKRYEGKVRSFLLNTGGVGEIPNPENPLSPRRAANRPWKNGIGYVTRALFRDSGEWSDDPDYGTRVLISGVSDEHGKIYDMKRFDPHRQYGAAEREDLVKRLNRERIDYLERFPKLDARIRQSILDTHRL